MIGVYEENSIYCGDSAQMMRELPDGSIDLILGSPPYDSVRAYCGFELDWRAIIKQAFRVVKDNGVVVWNVKDQIVGGTQTLTSFEQALFFRAVGFRVIIEYAEKLNPQPQPKIDAHTPCRELIIVASKGKHTFNPRRSGTRYGGMQTAGSNGRLHGYTQAELRQIKKQKVLDHVWYYTAGKCGQSDHPAKMNKGLAVQLVDCYSSPSDLILDPFMGSGTTAEVAMESGRRYLGFDVSQKYVDEAVARLATARMPLFVVS